MLTRRRLKLKPQLSKNNEGVTLVEVIAVIAVLGVVMAAVIGFMITSARMSAQVTGGASLGIREQTATEYINQRIWETTEKISTKQPQEDYPTDFTVLELGEDILTCADGKVTYNGVVLCAGEIRFEEFADGDTAVIYYLNDVRHVVHLRVAPGT